jgi:hypothetical protein
MAKPDPLARALDRLKAAEVDPTSDASKTELTKAIKSGHSALAARAARIALKASLVDLTGDLQRAFDRFLKDGANTDKGCDAKVAIATTLYETGKGEAETFLKGVRYRQFEPVWGRSVDTAGELRGTCGLGLVRVGYRDVAGELADLLADPEPQARIAAARGLAYLDRDEGALPLRTKILLGDDQPDVTGECLTALLRLNPVKYLSFVARFLDDRDDALRDRAAASIGQCKHPAAFELLERRWDATIDPNDRKALLPVIANVRSEASLGFLLGQINDASAGAARDVIEAMSPYRNDRQVRAKVEALVRERDNALVTDAFDRTFGPRVDTVEMPKLVRGTLSGDGK